MPGIDADSIVYQGERHWAPHVIGNHDNYKMLAQDWYRAGIKAQMLFAEQAIAHRLIPESIPQDQASHEMYQRLANDRVKRGDFIIRSAGAEIEVKCLTRYPHGWYLPWSHLRGHDTLGDITHSSVYFAIYERQGDSPVTDSLVMVSLETILRKNRTGELVYDSQASP